ncbi:MAG: DUF6600 domain-containing protein [Pyrinomonadaceae bacterium]
MSHAAKVFLAALFGITVFGGNSVIVFGADARTINVPEMMGPLAAEDDEEEPEVKDRVARISFIRGEARVKRLGDDEWEKATLNLPIVEGDEIATDAGSRIEIQLNKDSHLRLAENSYLKFSGLKDEGIAVSLSLGRMNLRLGSFEKEKSFFEIDVPKTTIAIQRSGAYRIDAGREGDSEIRVAASDGGEVRVYSDSAGFTVKNNRSARVFVEGASSGEWETGEAARGRDEFDDWASGRDETIAKRLRDASYDKYYDSDIYGADELDANGTWAHTVNYGYVWRPYPTVINTYADWSPYRYGHWRWMSPHGWVWINDEPWGWATYHHGRWFYDNGGWYWSPYGNYHHRRSWWRSALVTFAVVLGRTCWYPTSYYSRHYDYNRHNRRRGNGHPGPIVSPALPERQTAGILGRVKGPGSGVPGRLPPAGVVGVDTKNFGTRVGGIKSVPPDVAKLVLARRAGDVTALPDRPDPVRKADSDFRVQRPKVDAAMTRADIGAAKRRPDTPLDNELRDKRVFGGRPPQKITPPTDSEIPIGSPIRKPRETGAIERKPPERPTGELVKTIREPRETPRFDPPNIREKPSEEIRPVKRERPPAPDVETRRETPVRLPPAPRDDPPASKPPVRESPPAKEAPPKSESKPDPRPDSSRKKPDGR